MHNDQNIFYSTFKSPHLHNYPAVYWFWHHLPESQEIEQQLEEMKHAGYRTILIQPRLAFPRHQYLSKGYLEAYGYALRVVKKLGLTAGLYDDYNWISGHAGGKTVEGNDHLRECHLFWTSAQAKQGQAQCSITGIHNNLGDGLGKAFNAWCYDGEIRWGEWKIFRVFALPQSDQPVLLQAGAQYRLEDSGAEGCIITVDMPKNLPENCQVIAFVSARCQSSRLINYLHPEAAARFITVGYEPYRRALERYFGDPLKFIFFDQPYAGFYSWNEHFGNPLNSLMFDETLEQVFEEKKGYPLDQALLALVLPAADETARLRCDFFETYGELARSRFLGPICDWAKKCGLSLTGHELISFVGGWGFLEGLPELDARVNFGADYFAVDAYKTISAVDACNYHPQISARFGASTARAHGRKGCMVEQYSVPIGRDLPAPVGQWDLDLDTLRCQAVRHLLAGASQLLFHAYYQTNKLNPDATPLSSPRFDFPPGINYEPWFKFHPQFAEEIARLSAFLESAEARNQVAVLYPLRTVWYGGLGQSTGTDSAFWNRWLSEQGFGFDIIDERQITIQDESTPTLSDYRVLILPGVSVVRDQNFVDAVEEFVSAGNLLLASGPIPGKSQASGRDDALYERMHRLFEENPKAIHFNDWQTAHQDETLSEHIRGAQSSLVNIDLLEHSALPLWTWQGTEEDGVAVALFNDSLSARVVKLSWQGANWMPERCDPMSGESCRWGWFSHHGEKREVWLPMKPRELVCLRLLEAECKEVPHLIEMTGNAHVQTHLDEDGLHLQLNCLETGQVSLLFWSRERPQLDPGIVNASVIALEDERWRVDMDVPTLPECIALEQGWTLRFPKQFRDHAVDIRHGWEEEYPTYIGPGFYRNDFALTAEDLSFGWLMRFPHVSAAMVGYLNQDWAGLHGWPPFDLQLPQRSLKASYNHIEVAVWNSAGNAFYHDTPYKSAVPHVAGLAGVPVLIPFVRLRLWCK